MDAPYLRIVDDIRRRIGSGELRSGDAVPSARQLMREWRVANATATKALAALRQEGLVVARPGIGTRVAAGKPVRPRREPPTELSRDRIVRAAVDVADGEGMAALSMRRVALELDAATMSLYRHVGGKDELVLLMIDEVLGGFAFPRPAPDGWRARLEAVARLQWRGFGEHRWLAPAMSITRPQLVPNALKYAEWVMSALDGLGLSPGDLIHVHVTLFGFVRGLATSFEAEAEAEQDSGLTSDEWMEAQESTLNELAGSGAFGSFLDAVKDSDFGLDLDTVFEFGLQRLLDGFAVYFRS
jgi:DNA-binding transcriptional regulator YhcF (GntR family)